MKIAIATAVYAPMINGVAVFSRNLAVGLARRGHEVMVLCPSQNGKHYIEMVDGVKVVHLRSKQVKLYPDQIHSATEQRSQKLKNKKTRLYKYGFRVAIAPKKEVDAAMAGFKPDVIHIQVADMIGRAAMSYAKKHQIPVVITEHNQPEVLTDPLKLPPAVKKIVNRGLERYFRNWQVRSDFVTMPTERSIRHLLGKRRSASKTPIAAISNGVDLTNFRPGKVSPEFYQKYQLPQNRPVVLYVGRVDPEKQVGRVIEAFHIVIKKIPEALLVIVGDGVDRNRLINQVMKTGLGNDIKLVGRIVPPDLYEFYKMGQVFVTASEIETQGIVLIEAAACGLPLVAVDKGAVVEVCRNNENGFLCSPGDITEMGEAITKILIDKKLQKRFAEASLKIAKEHDFEKTLDKFINVYQYAKAEGKNRIN